MNKDNKIPNWSMDSALRYIYINEVIFVVLVLLCFIGELLAEATDRIAFFIGYASRRSFSIALY
nr:hypothetical protein [Methylomarinum sp. Ch1-1]MDP4520606.1 hypothetical protein [Methylomarinum sp. Ch1-1]